MRIIMVLGALFMTACGTAPEVEVNPEIAPFVKWFHSECRAPVLSGKIDFGPVRAQSQGYCQGYSDGTYEIVISRERWDTMEDVERQVLIAHELLHCEHRLVDLKDPTMEMDWMFWRGQFAADTQDHFEEGRAKYCHK